MNYTTTLSPPPPPPKEHIYNPMPMRMPYISEYPDLKISRETKLVYLVGCFVSTGMTAAEAITEAHKVLDSIEAGKKL